MPAQIDNAAFLLDIDLFIEAHQPFDAEELPRQMTMLHEQIDRFFRWALTSIGEEYVAWRKSRDHSRTANHL